jgi:hypothetical protein
VETEHFNTSARADTDVYFDPASNTMTVKHGDLAVAINERGSATRVSGSIPGGIVVKRHGQVGSLGRAPIDESFSKNIMAENTVQSAATTSFMIQESATITFLRSQESRR